MRIEAGLINYNESGDENETLDRGYRDISGVIGPLEDGAEVSDDGEHGRRRNDRMLE